MSMQQPASLYALVIVGVFATLGAGLGLAANFTLGFFIEQFVEPGTDPLDSTQIGIMLLVSIFLIYATGPIAAGIAGVGLGTMLPDREATAAVVAGVACFVGFFLFAGLAIFLTFSVLAEYGTAAAGGGGGGGSGGAGGPIDPAALGTLMVQVGLPVGLVGLTTAYMSARLSTSTEQ
jgi:hypothetical protein